MPGTKTYSGLSAVMQALGAAPPQKSPPPARWSKVTLTSLSVVEDLLDWLENNGYDERSLVVREDEFVVRWR